MSSARLGLFVVILGLQPGTALAARSAPPRPAGKPATRPMTKIDREDAERLRALVSWPEPRVPREAAEELERAEASLEAGDAQGALRAGTRLSVSFLGWRAPHWLLGRAYEALGHYDDAVRELTILLQLDPSHAGAWERLGRLLAVHGGTLDAEDAEQALAQALALLPGTFELWFLRAQLALRRRRPDQAERFVRRYLREAPALTEDRHREVETILAAVRAQAVAQQTRPRSRAVQPPSDHARELYQAALGLQGQADPTGAARSLLQQALADSPQFLDAVISAYGLDGEVPEASLRALWDDGDALLVLARRVRPAEGDLTPEAPGDAAEKQERREQTRERARAWLDRAIDLGITAALLERARLRSEAGDRQAALADLLGYVAAEPRPAGLEEARALLLRLRDADVGTLLGSPDPALALSRLRLLADRPAEALDVLGGRCEARTLPERLLGLGAVHEWTGEPLRAVTCYRQALQKKPADPEPLLRLSAIGARAPLPLLRELEPELRRAAGMSGKAAWNARWALARLLMDRGDREGALAQLGRYLREVPPDDPNRAAAKAAQERMQKERELAQQGRRTQKVQAAAAGGVLLLLSILWFFRGRSLGRALLLRPALFPEVARTVGALRHDVLKHRTSVLGLLGDGTVAREEVARMLWEPERASDLCAVAYERLRQAARGKGVPLRPLGREPVFGPLYRDLRRAETLLRRSNPGLATLRRVDARLRGLHSERLGALLRRGPRTRVDAALLSAWAREVEAELRVRGARWTPPVLLLAGLDGQELEFPVERQALGTLFANLLRNAQAAVAAEGEGGSVIVRAVAEREATGRRVLVLLVGDSATGDLSVERIERSESGRGLAVVRDLVHEWRGHLLLRPETAPWRKGVGACFPL